MTLFFAMIGYLWRCRFHWAVFSVLPGWVAIFSMSKRTSSLTSSPSLTACRFISESLTLYFFDSSRSFDLHELKLRFVPSFGDFFSSFKAIRFASYHFVTCRVHLQVWFVVRTFLGDLCCILLKILQELFDSRLPFEILELYSGWNLLEIRNIVVDLSWIFDLGSDDINFSMPPERSSANDTEWQMDAPSNQPSELPLI